MSFILRLQPLIWLASGWRYAGLLAGALAGLDAFGHLSNGKDPDRPQTLA